MKLYKFSEQSIEYARALNTLGFDVVHVIDQSVTTGLGDLCPARKVVAETVGRKCELPSGWFLEIPDNTAMAITYIIHSEELNNILIREPFNMDFGKDY